MTLRSGIAHILETPTYKPGDPEPSGYLQWHEWAEVQWKAGLRQRKCGSCGLFRFPQSLSDQVERWEAMTSAGEVIQGSEPLCKTCVELRASATKSDSTE